MNIETAATPQNLLVQATATSILNIMLHIAADPLLNMMLNLFAITTPWTFTGLKPVAGNRHTEGRADERRADYEFMEFPLNDSIMQDGGDVIAAASSIEAFIDSRVHAVLIDAAFHCIHADPHGLDVEAHVHEGDGVGRSGDVGVAASSTLNRVWDASKQAVPIDAGFHSIDVHLYELND